MNICIESAHQLSEHHRQQLQTKLVNLFTKDLTFEYQINPHLIGGFRITTLTKVVDLSLAARINQLNTSLLTSVTK